MKYLGKYNGKRVMYGFETRVLTDKVLKLFLNSIPKVLDRPRYEVELVRKPYPHMFTALDSEPEYRWFNWEHWIKQKTPIAFWGTVRGTKKLRDICLEHKINYYNFDHAYFFRTSHQSHQALNTPNYRITLNAENINFLCNDKFEQEDIDHINFYRKSSVGDQLIPSNRIYKNSKRKYILICPPSTHACKYFDIESTDKWISDMTKMIRVYTDRPIIIRKKQLKFDKPLIEDLKDAYCIITHQSTAAIQAVLNGVPSICDPSSCAAPVSTTKIENIENLIRPDNDLITRWVDSLLVCQFPTYKLANGYAKRSIDRLQSQNDYNT